MKNLDKFDLWEDFADAQSAQGASQGVAAAVPVRLCAAASACQREPERARARRRKRRSGRSFRRMLEGNACRKRGWDLSKGAGTAVRPVLQGRSAGRQLPGLHLPLQGPGQTALHGLRSELCLHEQLHCGGRKLLIPWKLWASFNSSALGLIQTQGNMTEKCKK